MPVSARAQRFAWCLYDFANSAFPTTIVTAVYVLYFKHVVAGALPPGLQDRWWGMANAAGALVVFVLAPIVGAAADEAQQKRRFWMGATGLCVAATAALSLWGPGAVWQAALTFGLALVGFETACVLYNAFLPVLAAPHEMDRLSGSGWALGYVGGLLSLGVALPVTLHPDTARWVPLVVAGWFALFSLPAFAVLRDAGPGRRVQWLPALRQVLRTAADLRGHRVLFRFLVAYFLYNNAVVTVIVFAVAFAADSLGFSTGENIALVIVMNAVAAPGAYLFGRIASRLGALPTVRIALYMWLAVVAGALTAAWPHTWTTGQAKGIFWGVAAVASLAIGAIQSTSRAFVGHLAGSNRSGEYYGYLAFAGKGSAIVGPLVFGLASGIGGDQRVAVGTIGVFFAAGLMALRRVSPHPGE